MRHLGQSTFEFTDITSRVISGTVSHDAFGAAYFTDCPHTKSSGECICPVDGAEVYVKRASGEEETVELNDGKFAQSVFEGETVGGAASLDRGHEPDAHILDPPRPAGRRLLRRAHRGLHHLYVDGH